MMPVIHGLFPVKPDEISGERAESEIEPEGVVEAERRNFSADIRAGRRHQARSGKADIHDERRQHHGDVKEDRDLSRHAPAIVAWYTSSSGMTIRSA